MINTIATYDLRFSRYRDDGEITEIHRRLEVGAPVEYLKGGGRNGWKGVIQEIQEWPNNRVVITWEEDIKGRPMTPAVEQSYSVEALTTRKPYEFGYILLKEWPLLDDASSSQPTWIIAGKLGGTPRRFQGSEQEARKALEERARRSNSGQPYVLYKALAEAKRTQPVVVTDYE